MAEDLHGYPHRLFSLLYCNIIFIASFNLLILVFMTAITFWNNWGITGYDLFQGAVIIKMYLFKKAFACNT